MKLSIVNDTLKIHWEWYEQLWGFNLQNPFIIPFEHITDVQIDTPESTWKELRAPGTFLPGVIKAGTYYTPRGREFWYVTQDKNYLTLVLYEEAYKRIVLTLEDNEFWQHQIRQHLTIS
ncbi:hypothetical protein QM565_11685 [Geitlerinema splendidum]|nr:hypothetical protein [Geitlerinema splendidum]